VASLIEAGRAERILDDRQLAAALDRAGRRAGVRTVKQVLQAHSDHGFTRSKAERLLRDLIRRAQLPPARHNVHVLGREVDALWPDQKLIVEVDGWQHHNRRAQFESDRARDRRLTAAGYRVIRVTWWQLVHEPVAVAASIAAALARAAAA
jgi:very-short-patch-repair endonuclease